MSGIRFTDGLNNNPTVEVDGVTYALGLDHPSAFANTLAGARPVKQAAATLLASESGALCLFNLAAGFTYTLPAAAEGLWFEFWVTTTVTSVLDRVACATGDFFLGSFIQSTDGTYTTAAHAANGTTHLAWEGDGSTTGGLAGDWLRVHAISGSQWAVIGFGRATGSEATPWKTS